MTTTVAIEKIECIEDITNIFVPRASLIVELDPIHSLPVSALTERVVAATKAYIRKTALIVDCSNKMFCLQFYI